MTSEELKNKILSLKDEDLIEEVLIAIEYLIARDRIKSFTIELK